MNYSHSISPALSTRQKYSHSMHFVNFMTLEDIGFNNVNGVIDKLIKQVPEDISPRCMVQIRIENKDKGQKQDYTRTIA